jgi:immune inhibitor A
MRKVSIFIILILSFYELFAAPGYPHPVEITQPDGSKIMILVKGDEFFRYRTTLDGYIIAQGDDGYYYYADYNRGMLSVSSARVSAPTKSSGGGYAKKIPDYLYNTAASSDVYVENSLKKIRALVIPVQFKDVKFSVNPAKEHFDKMINLEGYSENGASGSVKDYFRANLANYIEPEFVVSDIVSLPKDQSYYGNNEESGTSVIKYDVHINEMVADACNMIDSKIDFSKFDNDNDGKVDNVFLYFAGYSEAEGGNSSSLWPVSTVLKSSSLYLDGVRIYSYATGSELRGASGNIPSGIGVFCHEFCHILGLKDLYDTDYEANGQSKGLWGTLSVMDFGCYNNQGMTPPYFCAIDRELAGCGNGVPLEKDKNYILEPIHKSGLFYKVLSDSQNEYFLLETREERGWDTYIGGSGMLIYHIDKSDNAAGMINASVRWRTNTINTYSGHECADLVEASPLAVNIRQVFFPGLASVKNFTALTNPPFLWWNIKNTGLKITDIKSVEEGVSFMVSEEKNERLLKILSPSIDAYQRDAVLKWKSDLDIKGRWGVRWRLKNGSESDYQETETEEKSYKFENIEAGKDYLCELFYKGDIYNGDTTKISFKTVSVTSDFPYIYGLKENITVGDTVTLKVFNINEPYKSVNWFVNNSHLLTEQYVFSEAGIVTISAHISYISDKSVEIIKRKVIVSLKEDEDE